MTNKIIEECLKSYLSSTLDGLPLKYTNKVIHLMATTKQDAPTERIKSLIILACQKERARIYDKIINRINVKYDGMQSEIVHLIKSLKEEK